VFGKEESKWQMDSKLTSNQGSTLVIYVNRQDAPPAQSYGDPCSTTCQFDQFRKYKPLRSASRDPLGAT